MSHFSAAYPAAVPEPAGHFRGKTALNERVYGGAWNPQGTLIAFITTDFLWIYTADLQFVEKLTMRLPGADPDQSAWLGRLRWSPDSSKLSASVVYEGTIDHIPAIHRYGLIWDTITWVRTVITDYMSTSTPVVFSPDGNIAAGVSHFDDYGNFIIKFYHSDDGSLADIAMNSVHVPPVDAEIIAVAGATTIQIWNINTAVMQGTIPNFNGDRGFLFSPENGHLAFFNNDWDVEIWSIHPLERIRLIDEPVMLSHIQWAGDDLITADFEGNYKRWNLETGEATFMIQSESFVPWNPDGSMYLITDDTGIFVYEAATRALKAKLLYQPSASV